MENNTSISDSEQSKNVNSPRWWTTVEIVGYRMRALIDSGASCTVFGRIGIQLATALGAKILPYPGEGETLATAIKQPVYGWAKFPIQVGELLNRWKKQFWISSSHGVY